MKHSYIMAKLLLLLFGITVAWGQWGTPGNVIEKSESGEINYSELKIRATGMGAISGEEKTPGEARLGATMVARYDAYRKLIETVNGVRLTSETTIRNSVLESDVIRTQVSGMVRGAKQVGEVKYLSDTSIELTLEVPLSGIMDLVLPRTDTAELPPAGEMTSTTETPAAGVPAESALAAPAIAGQPVTGLIIDARGLGVKPSMSPRILADDGSVLYGPGKYTRDFAITQGVVGYHKDIEAAKNDTRVAGNPLTIKGVRTSGTLATDVIISMSDAQQAAGYDGFARAIDNCLVMFILD